MSLGAAASCSLPAHANAQSTDKKFLYIFNDGGWDPFCTFVPAFGVSGIEMEPDAEPGQYGNIPVVEHPSRPAFGNFMSRYSSQLCVINGMELRSVTHQRCTQLLMTGKASSDVDDWPSIMAAKSKQLYPTPHLVIRGPAYSTQFASHVVRVGMNGQLTRLLEPGLLFGENPPMLARELLEDEILKRRLMNGGRNGKDMELRNSYLSAIEQFEVNREDYYAINLDGIESGCVRDIRHDANNIFKLFSKELARSAMISYKGVCDLSWDTHASHDTQQENVEEFYGFLTDIMEQLEASTNIFGAPLIDDVVVVVISEMGRSPVFNTYGGRDHWTFTSALLMGAGIKGNQSIGGLDSKAIGRPISLETGEMTDNGVMLLPQHLGATLLALGDVDYGRHVNQDVHPISAVML